MANKKKNKKNKKKNSKSPLPTAESISVTPPSAVNPVRITPPLPQSMVKPVSDSPPSPPPRTPLPPVFFENTVFIKIQDMTYKMRYEAFDVADDAFKKHLFKNSYIAEEIKKEFEKRHGLNWHCIVGASYGLSITSIPKRCIYFYMSGKAVLLFKY
ncbi:unnamed protein product [Lathyrus sativus]|nr:unnamed protein product [Lathyrus sativus]